MGRSSDVAEDQQETRRKARSAAEGFTAVAKHLRGFGQSLSGPLGSQYLDAAEPVCLEFEQVSAALPHRGP